MAGRLRADALREPTRAAGRGAVREAVQAARTGDLVEGLFACTAAGRVCAPRLCTDPHSEAARLTGGGAAGEAI